jgi:hypothetical protein
VRHEETARPEPAERTREQAELVADVVQPVDAGDEVEGPAGGPGLDVRLDDLDARRVEPPVAGPFFKAVCKVSDAELERAKEAGDWVSISESALDGQEVAVAFRPRAEWPKAFRFLRLYR